MQIPKIIQEFKKFIIRGNVIELAVGVIIGSNFQKIVSSVVNDLFMPFIGLITGNANFNDQFIILKLPEGITKDMVTSKTIASELGVNTFNYGAFITSVLDFLIIAAIVFILVKSINSIADKTKKKEIPVLVVPNTKLCPYCFSEIKIEATRCPACTSVLDEKKQPIIE